MQRLWKRVKACLGQRIPLRSQRGFVMIVAAMLVSGLLGVAVVSVQQTRNSTSQAARGYQETRAFYAAEGGSAVATDWLVDLLAEHPSPSTELLSAVPTPIMPGFNFIELSVTPQPRILGRVIASGPYAGMRADIQPYLILSHAENASSSVDGVVRQTIEQQLIGMYQFGIYYDDDLEFFPRYPLDYHGRIHTNGDLYLGSSDVLNLDAMITSAGQIFNTPKDPTIVLHGKARISDAAGHWRDLSYDSRDPDWATQALEDWDGRLLDSSHAVTRLAYPLPTPSTSIDIIQRGLVSDDPEMREKRFYWRAGLRIIDGTAYDSSGNVLAVPTGMLTSSTVYDYREGHDMNMTNLDMSVLLTSAIVPANRIVYISATGANAAVRLINGSTLPAQGLTIASDNPVYVRGNFNTVNKKPCSILCDAFNVYSNNWSDANATKALNKRIASATWVNTCVVAGNTTTTAGNYNGGAENLIRLHEKWVGHELTYRGSLVCIWESQQATGDWEDASYIEAHRDWAFDQQLLDPAFWPQDEMSLRSVTRGTWSSQ